MATSTTRRPPPEGPGRSQRRRALRPFGDAGEAERRPMAAGHVLLVGIILLMVGWMLNAPGIKKTAAGMPLGWRRDVAQFFADPVASLSSVLQTDRPREWLQDSLGRAGDDDINTALPSPTTVPGATNAAGVPVPTTIKKPAFSPTQPLTMWVGGDSLAVTPGESIIAHTGFTGGTVRSLAEVEGHVATGLARPEVFNWSERLGQVMTELDPRLVVFSVGPNDDQPLTGGEPTGDLGNPAWDAEYRRRVGGIMDQIVSQDRYLVWIGAPPIRNMERAEGEYKVINEIFRNEAEKRPGRVFYVDIYPLFLDGGGGYADYLDNGSGTLVKMRADDGIHFTREGGDRIAREVFKVIEKSFDLTSWQSGTTSTTSTAPPASAPGASSTAPAASPASPAAPEGRRRPRSSTTTTTPPAAPATPAVP
jgi:hypothetical protein